MKIDFIIPTYGMNGNKLTEKCVWSLRKYLGYENINVMVVIDGITDEIYKDAIDRLGEYRIELLNSKQNKGFAKTVNKGLKNSSADIKVLLNNDTIFYHDIIPELIKSFEYNGDARSVGIVGGKLLYPDNSVQFGGMYRAYDHHFYHTDQGKLDEVAFDANLTRFVIGITGAFFAISEECYKKLGTLAEGYFAGHEDVIYCLDAWNQNFSVLYNTNISLFHLEGKTRGSTSEEKSKINKDWYDREQKCTAKFKNEFKEFDILSIEKMVCKSNNPIKEQMLSYYNDKRITLGIKRSGAIGDCLLLTPILARLDRDYPGIDINVLTQCPQAFKNSPSINYVTNDPNDFTYDVYINLDDEYEKYADRNIVQSYMTKIFGNYVISPPVLYPSYEDIAKYSILRQSLPKQFVSVHMAKSWDCRTLELSKWRQILNAITKNGHDVLVLGRGADLIIDDIVGVHDLRDKTSLIECQQIIASSDLFIGTDSALYHVASSTATPIISIFTCVNPETRMTRGSMEIVAIPPHDVCRFKLSEEKKIVNNHICNNEILNECIKSIDIELVIEAIDEILI